MRSSLLLSAYILIVLALVSCGTSGAVGTDGHSMAEDTLLGHEASNEHDMDEEQHESMDMSSSSSMVGERIVLVLNDVGGAGYTMTPEVNSAHAGPVTFVAQNEGLIEHELIVVKLLDMGVDLADLNVVDGQIPEVDEGGAVYLADADGSHYGQVIAATGHGMHLKACHTIELNADLAEGRYMLLCNIATHYQLGMWSEFEAS